MAKAKADARVRVTMLRNTTGPDNMTLRVKKSYTIDGRLARELVGSGCATMAKAEKAAPENKKEDGK